MRLAFICLLLFALSSLICEECAIADFTLDKAEQLALDCNKDLTAMRELLEKGKQGRLESISKWLPQINLISKGYAAQRRLIATGARSAFLSQFELTQTLFSSEKYYNVKISTLEVEQLQLLLDSLMLDVLFDVRAAYYRVVLDKLNMETAKKNVEILTSLAEKMRSNYQIGTSILLNVNQSKVAIANAMSLYYQYQKQYQIDVDALALVLGFTPGCAVLEISSWEIPIFSIPEIASKVYAVEKVFINGDGDGFLYHSGFPESENRLLSRVYTDAEVRAWENRALDCRPDLRSKCVELKIADQQIRKQKGEYWPRVHLEVNYGGGPERMEERPSSSFFNQKFSGAVGFQVGWLLYDSYGRKYRINQARYERNARNIEYAKGVQNIFGEVRKQIFELKESIANYVTAEGNVRLAEQTLELADKQLNIGYITVFDYQIVVDGLIQALNIRNQASFDLISGYYGLRHASGADLFAGGGHE